MKVASLTTRIDPELKAELEKIARFDRRSTSFVATQAIRNLVEERRATRELIAVGLDLIEKGANGIPSETVHEWFLADEDALFPQAPSK